ncbi:MAG: hypothetical protein FWH04_07540 [Oscillospiraceae bacterium]|nr:hypothetical protein [Oscillospiraceae bacterium]
MAVSRMILTTIVGKVEHFDKIVQHCVIGSEFHPEPAESLVTTVEGLCPFELTNPYFEPLRHAESLFRMTGLSPAFAKFDGTGCDLGQARQYLDSFEARLNQLLDQREGLERRLREDGQLLNQIEKFQDLTVPFQDLFTVTYTKFRYGRIPRDMFGAFHRLIDENDDFFFFVTDRQKDFLYGIIMTPRATAETVDSLFASLHFERIRLPGWLTGSGEEALASVRSDIEASQREITQLQEQRDEFLANEKPEFMRFWSFLRFMSEACAVRRYALHSEGSFYLLGWVPEGEAEAFSKSIGEWEEVSGIVITEEAGMDGPVPPTKLTNRRIFRPFEPLVAMYGLPSYDEIDPTPLIAFSYPLIFGAMFGDLGHGVLLFPAGLLMWKLKKMWLGKILCYCALSSMFFGLIFGAVFGSEEVLPFGFHVLDSNRNSHILLQVSIYSGVGIITLAILLNIINGIRQKNVGKSLFGINSLSGLFLYSGIVLIVFPFIGFGEFEVPLLPLLALIILSSASLFFHPVFSQWIKKQSFKPQDGAGIFIFTGFVEVFESLLAFISNTLSFLRIGAYAICHAAMMAVIFTLAETISGSYNVWVLIFGNLFVAAIEAFLVGIQTLRLNFYEIFGRFYSGSGREYRPLKIDYENSKSE